MQAPFPQRRGFTLVELLVVITLMSVAVGTVIFRLDNLTARGRLQSAAASLQASLRLAQMEAKTSSMPRKLSFVPDRRLLLRTPKRSADGWSWDKGREFLWATGVVVERVRYEGGNPDAGRHDRLVILVKPDGRFRALAVVMACQGQTLVALLRSGEEPRLFWPVKPPQALTFDLLMLELEQAGEGA